MTYFPDLGPLTYFQDELGPLSAVGWLGLGHDFPRRPVPPQFFERLFLLLIEPWERVFFMGSHDCELCTGAHFDALLLARDHEALKAIRERRNEWMRLEVGDRRIRMGHSNLFVPGEGCIYGAPSMIAHYIQAHGYGPPEEFINAVLRCPDMQSEAYRDLCIANGGEQVVEGWPGPAGA